MDFRTLTALAVGFLTPCASGADQAPPADPQSALDAALLGLDAASPAPAQPSPSAPLAQFGAGGGATIKLADISLDVLTAAGGSTATDDEIATLQGGDHDPHRRGFTFQQAEISLFGAVDPYFNAEAHIVFKTGGVELEEAYGTTTQLPADLQVKVGYFFTEFGRTNPQHPHQWPWLDQPIANTRIFGKDGTRGVGERTSWLVPVSWFSEAFLGVQNPDDPSQVSFLGGEAEPGAPQATIGGRPAVVRTTHSLADFLYLARWVNCWDVADSAMVQLGLSSAFGPNNTGPRGSTELVGADLLVKCHELTRGYPSLTWQTEVIARRYRADTAVDPTSAAAIDSATLRDWGLTSQALIGFAPRWAAGFRGEYATGNGDSYLIGTGPISRQDDPLRDDRWRLSPLITFNPTEFSKLRFQYDYDHAEHLPSHQAHSVWLGLEVMIGAHPAHNY